MTTEDAENTEGATPETDARTYIPSIGAPTVPAEFARKLERERDEAKRLQDYNRAKAIRREKERDEAREERDWAIKQISTLQLTFEGLQLLMLKEKTETLQRIDAENDKLFDEAYQIRIERDEAREALKKCREDSICYAEHMRRCGYVAAYKESQENADRATIILDQLKEGAK
jgi:hypothetical protein